MNHVIKVSINEKQEQTVSARDLYKALSIKKDFTSWFKKQCERIGLQENVDYSLLTFLGEQTGRGGHNKVDYAIKLELAKHLAMISGGDRAYKIRQYFIEVEKSWNSPEQIMARALQLSNKKIDEYKTRLEGAEQFQRRIASSQNSLLVREVAKLASSKGMQIGEHGLWQKLRDWGLIIKGKTEPYQRYIDRGYFELAEGVRESASGTFTFWTTRVTGRGQIYIIKRLVEESLKDSFEEA